MSDDAEIQGAEACPRCGRLFTCGMKAGHAACWCAGLPHRPPPDPGVAGCYCPACLRELLAASVDQPR
ncbi:MAG: cysteine-rich CWC family protein [Rhodocyclaceae bacterium]|nr:cysteine-rich CWC family protein [Rhodocyclaceae bacterium]